MCSERLKLEQKLLEEENANLKRLFVFTIIGIVILVLALVLLQHHLRIRHLEKENERLEKERKQAEKAFDMKNEFITNITNDQGQFEDDHQTDRRVGGVVAL